LTIADLGLEVQDRLEEPRGTPGTFWSLQAELYPLLVEAMNAATLVTGEPQARGAAPYTLTPMSNVQPMPAGAVAILRVEGPGQVLKTSVYDLDRFSPGWQGVLGSAITYWFPIGLTQFGIYPQVPTAQEIVLSYVAAPVAMASSYDGTQAVPFQSEYSFGFVEWAAAMARLKEGGQDWLSGLAQYDAAIDKLLQLNKYGWRRGAVRMTRALGVQADVTEVSKRG
jgi:hypothetical protein